MADPQVTSFPKSKIRVLLLENIHECAADLLSAEGFDVSRVKGAMDEASLMETAADAHVLGIRSKTNVSAKALESMQRLLTLGCFCIGTNQVALDDAKAQGVPVFNSPFGNTRSVAELTIAEIVALYRRLGDRSAQMHAGEWVKSASGSHEIRGKTLGIIGYGHIGSQVSVLGEAMGLRVIYHDIVPKLALGNAQRAGSLEDLLSQSDAVTLHVPADSTTKSMIGKAELDKMKPGAMLINNARGSVVDLDALAASLKSGAVGGAAIDVFPEEPKTSGDPFDSMIRGLPNVILTPHIGGSTEEAQENIASEVATKIIRFINNGSTTGAVNMPEVELPEQAGDPRPHRVLHLHKNVPGVLRQMHGIIADMGINVEGEYLRTDDKVGYVVLDVDPKAGEPLADALRDIPETIRVRPLF